MKTAPQDGVTPGGTTKGRQTLTGMTYRPQEQHADLGIGYPPLDDTDDLVGAQENASGRDLGGSAGGSESTTHEGADL